MPNAERPLPVGPRGVVDTHAHLTMAPRATPDEPWQRAAHRWLQRAKQVHMRGVIAIAEATQPALCSELLHLVHGDAGMALVLGAHPHEAQHVSATVLGAISDAAKRHRDKVVAIGEIGLDYHYNHSPPAVQRDTFVRQLRLARVLGLPVVIHTREAEADTLSILNDEWDSAQTGVFHCFSGGDALADAALEMGFYLSFSGVVTFPKAQEIAQVAARIPASSMLVETDAPFLAPVPLRGRKNEPANALYTLGKLAELRGVDADVLARQTAENARRCFGLPSDWGWDATAGEGATTAVLRLPST